MHMRGGGKRSRHLKQIKILTSFSAVQKMHLEKSTIDLVNSSDQLNKLSLLRKGERLLSRINQRTFDQSE